jgi:hypothetical protein
MCQPNKPKYLHGSLIYLPSLQAVAAIGHCCADKENLAAATREYNERIKRNDEEDYLLAHIPLVPAYLSVLERVRPAAREAERIYREFRKAGAVFQRPLRLVQKVGGRLAVEEQLAVQPGAPAGLRTRQSSFTTREIEFGFMCGLIALTGDYNPVRELDRIVAAVTPHNHGDSGEAALDYIAPLDSLSRHAATVKLRQAPKDYSRFRRRLADFCAFFTPDNIRLIHQWASHPAQPEPFSVSLNGNKCTFYGRSGVCSITLAAVLWTYDHPWPRPPQD